MIRTLRAVWVLLILAAVLVLGATPALADRPDSVEDDGVPGNNGTVKIHDGASEDDPLTANDPKVCTFHLHFRADEDQTGDWYIIEEPPFKDDVVLSGTYTTDAEGEYRTPADGESYSLPDGHYKLYWEGAENPGGQTPVKHKVFKVECEAVSSNPPEETATPTPTPTATPVETPAETPVVTATPTPNQVIRTAPTPGATLPDTATSQSGGGTILAILLALTTGAAVFYLWMRLAIRR